MTEIEIAGLAELDAKFAALIEGTKAKVAKATAGSLLTIQSGAKRDCPVDTGRLRAGNQIRIDADKMGGEAYNDVEYGPYVENGTRFQKPRPFLYPNWQSETDHYLDKLRAIFS